MKGLYRSHTILKGVDKKEIVINSNYKQEHRKNSEVARSHKRNRCVYPYPAGETVSEERKEIMNNFKQEINKKKQLLNAVYNTVNYLESVIEDKKDREIKSYEERIKETDDEYDQKYYSELLEDEKTYIEACEKIIGTLTKLI